MEQIYDFDVSALPGLSEKEEARRLVVLFVTLRNIQVSGEPLDNFRAFEAAWARARNVSTARKFNEIVGLDVSLNPRILNGVGERAFRLHQYEDPISGEIRPDTCLVEVPLPNRGTATVILYGLDPSLVREMLDSTGHRMEQISRGIAAFRARRHEVPTVRVRERSPSPVDNDLHSPPHQQVRLEELAEEENLAERSEHDPAQPLVTYASRNPFLLESSYPWARVLGFPSVKDAVVFAARCVRDILRRRNYEPAENIVESFRRLFILGMRFATKVISNFTYQLHGAQVMREMFEELQINVGPANLAMFLDGVYVGVYTALRSFRNFFNFPRNNVAIWGGIRVEDQDGNIVNNELYMPILTRYIYNDSAHGLDLIIAQARDLFEEFTEWGHGMFDGHYYYGDMNNEPHFFSAIFLSLHGIAPVLLRSREEYVRPVDMERLVDMLELRRAFDPSRDQYLNLNMQVRNVPDHQVRGDNAFWFYTFEGNAREYYKSCAKNCIMMPAEINGKHIEGCFQRALLCRCQPNRQDKAVYCKCFSENDPSWEVIYISTIKGLILRKELPHVVISIRIPKKGSTAKKSFDVLVVSPLYYQREDRRVIFLNEPEWGKVTSHCCLWVNPDKPEVETPFQKFARLGSFNELIHKICKTDDSVCPICGLLFNKNEAHAHFKTHCSDYMCTMCGLCFHDENELNIHKEFHCKKIGIGCVLSFSDEFLKYRDRGEITSPIVYADLESAITADGTHLNILCGWVNRDQLNVNISSNIKDMFDAISAYGSEVIIYFHNGEGYDFHFLILELSKLSCSFIKDFSIICDSSEKIRFFSVKYKGCTFKFRDTFAFVSESLSKWVESSKKSACPFKCFKANFPEVQKQTVVLQKNPFPYNAIRSEDDLKLPIKKMIEWMFDEECERLFCYKFSADELQHEIYAWFRAAKVLFNWRTIGDYYRTYLICDVSQLCDCMEFFADNVKSEFGEEAHAYYGTPSLTWGAWLKQNAYELQPVREEMYDIINSSIRGGQTGAMTRYFDRDTIDEKAFMCDLDCNSLYATVMLKFKYPCHDFRFENMNAICEDNILDVIKKLHAEGRSGFVEVDMDVYDKISMQSYMPVASKRTITGCYNYHAMACYAYGMGDNPETMSFSGLVNVAGEHLHYCCHTRLLEFYLEHKFVCLKKVHRLLTGVEEPVFEDYVQNNLEQRKKYASDPIKKMLYKLLNNSLYGKTYEDITHRKDLRMELTSTISKDDINIRRIIQEYGKWTLLERRQVEFFMSKPVYLGACITEYSKLWMYKFFYDKIRPVFPMAEVYYTDTDALTIKFPARYDWEEGDLKPVVTSMLDLANQLNTEEEQIIDTSNFDKVPDESRHTRHNNEPGLFKSETGSKSILKMVALRAKTYIMLCEDGLIKMSVKGCPMAEKTKLTFDDFYSVLMGDGIQKIINYGAIRSKFHVVKSVNLSRVVLSADDRKRYIADDKIHTYPLFCARHMTNINNGLDLDKIIDY